MGETVISMLNPKTQTFTVDGHGGIPELTQSLTSAAMAGMPEKWRIAIGYFVQRDDKLYDDLKNHILIDIVDIANRDHWQIPERRRKGYLTRMVLLAIEDYKNPKKYKTEDDRALQLDIPRATWFRTVKSQYSEVINIIDKDVGCGISYINAKLG